MRCEWKEVCLGDLTKWSSGGTPSKNNPLYWNGTIPWISAKNMPDGWVDDAEPKITELGLNNGSRLAPPKSILVLVRGSGLYNRRYICITRKAVAFNQDVKCIEPNDEVLPEFLYYWLRGNDKSLVSLLETTGTGAGKFDTKRLQQLRVVLPSLQEQKKIISLLCSLDDKIELNNKINENLERQAETIYKSWFVDFEPFGGMMPDDWRKYKLAELLPVITGKKNANISSDKGMYPFFSCSQDFSWTDQYSFEGNAILVAGNGDFNVKWYNGKFEAYQRTYVLIPYNPQLTSWLYYMVKYNLAQITSAARGSVIKFITKSNLENFCFYAPKALENLEIINAFAKINKMIDNNIQENYCLIKLRNILLPKLMSEEVDAFL